MSKVDVKKKKRAYKKIARLREGHGGRRMGRGSPTILEGFYMVMPMRCGQPAQQVCSPVTGAAAEGSTDITNFLLDECSTDGLIWGSNLTCTRSACGWMNVR